MGQRGTAWDRVGLCGTVWDHVALYGTLWVFVGLYGTLWDGRPVVGLMSDKLSSACPSLLQFLPSLLLFTRLSASQEEAELFSAR